jgi:GNAT superfamily N-acetyltransferase
MATDAAQARPSANAARVAEPADVPALTRMLVRAYMDDPVAIWMCGAVELRERLLASLYAARLRELLSHQTVWTNPTRSSASVWMAPGRQTGVSPSFGLLRCLLDPRMLARLAPLAVGFDAMRRKHPRQPHWYLSLLGTDPSAREQGLGSAMLEPVLERCDAERVGAYLESSKPRNLDFYARFGFETIDELQMPFGPKLWPMWRAPRRRAQS